MPEQLEQEAVIEAAVLSIVNEVAEPRENLSPEDLLVDHLGLRSLDLARIVAVLEVELGLDPFSELVPITDVRTVGDLSGAYRLAAEGEPASAPDEPATPRRRSEARLRRDLRAGARERT
jgi:acyl carrier protein